MSDTTGSMVREHAAEAISELRAFAVEYRAQGLNIQAACFEGISDTLAREIERLRGWLDECLPPCEDCGVRGEPSVVRNGGICNGCLKKGRNGMQHLYRVFSTIPGPDGASRSCEHRHRSSDAAYSCGVRTFRTRGILFDVFRSVADYWEKCDA